MNFLYILFSEDSVTFFLVIEILLFSEDIQKQERKLKVIKKLVKMSEFSV